MSEATTRSRSDVVPAIRQLVGASRPLSWINTAYPFGFAYLVAGGGLDVSLLIGSLYFLVPYNLLMYGINDVFDFESDLRNARKGGVEGVVLQRRWHRSTMWTAALLNAPLVVLLILRGTLGSTLVLIAVLFTVVAYSAPGLRFKERPLLDSLTSSAHFTGPAVFGLFLAGAEPTVSVVSTLAAFFIWGAASHAFGAVQDIVADRSAGIASVATWLGAAHTTQLALVLYLLAALLTLGVQWPGPLAGLMAAAYAINVVPFRSLPDADCQRANAGWRRFLILNYVTGFVITQLALWLVWHPGLTT